mgnify:CR=1 FL=1
MQNEKYNVTTNWRIILMIIFNFLLSQHRRYVRFKQRDRIINRIYGACSLARVPRENYLHFRREARKQMNFRCVW